MTNNVARLIMLLWLALPAGAVYSIWTGDLRALGIGLVVFVVGWALFALTVAGMAAQRKAKK